MNNKFLIAGVVGITGLLAPYPGTGILGLIMVLFILES